MAELISEETNVYTLSKEIPSNPEVSMRAQFTGQSEEGSDARLVAKAATRAGSALGLRQNEIAEIVGISPSQVSKIKDGAVIGGKAFELALYLIRVFRSLDAITGGDASTNRAWMRNPNRDLNGVPAELMKTAAGLVGVMSYLDSARAPL